MIETQYNAKVRVLRSDNGGEYQSSDLQKYLEDMIIHQTTCSNTPQQNGVAERKIGTSQNFQTPLQALTNAVVAPTVPNLPPRVFGCVAFVHLHKHQRTKLTSHALQCVFVGYALHKKGYRCYHPPTRQMYITMDVVFHEDSMYFSSESELQGSTIRKFRLSIMIIISLGDESGQSELVNQKRKNETWELVECPPGKKPVGCRWIYTVKYKADGSIERFKARLVAKGYTQTYGIDYTETFAPVAKINTVRVLLSLAANLDWPLQQFDVKNAFLHGELSEEVYMDLPPGCMVSEKQCQKVCKLKKSLYGLKQSPRAWFGRFTKSMRAFGYRQITGNDPEERKALQNYLSREFEMKDLDLLQETGMSGCQPVNTPIEEGLKLCVEPNQVSTDKGRYQRLVGRLMYLAHTRPDLAYALSVSIEVYTDADWAGAVDDRRSTSGYFTFVGGNLVTWKSYLSRQPIRLFCDNKAACDIAHNPVQHDRTKHVEVDRFFIKEKLDDKIVELPKIRSEDQLADILTKVLKSSVLKIFRQVGHV
ncbi:Retrovirus-related Pol polyprotein from transposon RE1 [Vitis vinifera]|uniref:Retrovirus-related Pol polyprotein from transposon RE1 n=1 Tax=Vitis vinifera TaxID=29760 RepID=A0A438G397_VITVI|nr:Retrovirus-related Pol polyprotein from transposon RE1 [Vitis vinifera]